MCLDEFTLVEMVMEKFKVSILKPSSQETTTWSEFYAVAHSVMFVVDSADLRRMKETKKTLKRLISHPFIAGKPILMWAMQRNGPWACVDIQSSQVGKKNMLWCSNSNCNCMFSGSPINKTRRKHWIKQKLWRSSTWRGWSTRTSVRVILWAAVDLYRSSFHWGVESGTFTCGLVPTPGRILCPSGLHRHCQQNDEGWPGVALQRPWPQLRVHRMPRAEGYGHAGRSEGALQKSSITWETTREVRQTSHDRGESHNDTFHICCLTYSSEALNISTHSNQLSATFGLFWCQNHHSFTG